VLYEVLGRQASNIFVTLSEAQWREARRLIITIILGTDMAHHFEQISKTQVFVEVHGEDTKAFCAGLKDEVDCLKEDKNRLFVLELVLHCSDISNPFKPFELCAKWADLVVEEFCRQGDRERSEGMEISPMCDRAALNLCNMQMGFIEFVVAPLISGKWWLCLLSSLSFTFLFPPFPCFSPVPFLP
jgi:cAMP-specific phosphodiesterase 4